MNVLQKRVVISQGDLNKPAPKLHLVGPADSPKSAAIAITPRPQTPLQQAWWTPFANLPGLGEFQLIRAQRAPITDWNKALVTVKSKVESAAKIAVMVYAVAAEEEAYTTATASLARSDIGKLHTNEGSASAVELTLPKARGGYKGAEIFIEVKAAVELKIVPRTTGIADKLRLSGADVPFARSATAGERLVIRWANDDIWSIAENTAGWSFA